MTKKYHLTVDGDRYRYTFDVWVNPQYIDEWRKDGLDIVENVNTIPLWAVNMGLMGLWIAIQDFWNRFRF